MEKQVTLAKHGDLFCIPAGDGYTCLGFDVCMERTRRYAEELKRPDLMPKAPRGTLESYAEYSDASREARRQAERTGVKLNAELSPQLIGLEGWRVEVVTTYGETRRFIVGKSTGWIPCHLEIKHHDSHGGGAAEREYTSVKALRKVHA